MAAKLQYLMACTITFTDSGIRVLTETQKPSILFSSINENPFIQSQEKALETYKNIFSEKFESLKGNPHPVKTDSNGEPILYYLSQGTAYANYKEALDNTQAGEIQAVVLVSDNISYDEQSNADIIAGSTIGINSDSAFAVMFSINSNSNPDTLEGFINQQVRLGYINGKKRLSDGVYKLQGAGESLETQKTYSQFALEQAQKQFGAENARRNTDGTLEITPQEGIDKQKFADDLKEGKFPALERSMGTETAVGMAYNIYREKNSLYRDGKTEQEVNALSEKQLVNSLTSFLSKIGVNVTSIEEYKQRYADKNGIEPSAEALADIANKVIAFSQGGVTIENMTEEVAHFAVEAYQDQEMLERMLANVHLSAEWAEAPRYIAAYGQKYEGAELDNIVRREILGKILARKLRENFQDTQDTPVEQGYSNLLSDLWNALVAKIQSLFTPSIQTELDNFTDAVANNILLEQFDSVFDGSGLSRNEYTMYSLNDKKVTARLQSYYNSLQKLNTTLKQNKAGNLDLKPTQEMLENSAELSKAESWMVIQQLNSGIYAPLNKLKRRVEEAQKQYDRRDPNQNKLYLDADTTIAISAMAEVKPVIQDIITIIQNGTLEEIASVNKSNILADLRSKIEDINNLEAQERFFNSEALEFVVESIKAKMSLTSDNEGFIDGQIRTAITQETKDVTWFTKTFGQLRASNNIFLNLLGRIFSENRIKALSATQQGISGFITHIQNNGFNLSTFRALSETDENGNSLGFLQSAVKMGQFYKDFDAFKAGLIRNSLEIKEEITDRQVLNRLDKLNNGQRVAYEQGVREWLRENTEQRFTEEYQKQREEETAWLSQPTKDLQRAWSSRRFAIWNKYPKIDGKPDLSSLTDSDRLELADIARERKFAKSIYNDDGSFKEEGTDSYQIAQDLIELDNRFKDNPKSFTLKAEFLQTLQQIEGENTIEANKRALKWIEANGGTRFTKEFFDLLGTRSEETEKNKRPKVVERLLQLASELEASQQEEVEILAQNIEKALNERSDILRKYQKVGNPAEVEASAMTETSKDRVRNLDTAIQDLFREVNQKLRQNGSEEVTSAQVETENTENESYYADLRDSGVKESEFDTYKELEFILENVSPKDRVEIEKFTRKLENIREGLTFNIEPKYRRFFQNYFNLDTELSDEDFFFQVKDRLMSPQYDSRSKVEVAFAKTKMYSYYKRFAPRGYSEFLEDLNNGLIKPSDLLSNREELQKQYEVSQYVEITPSYMWNDDTNVPAEAMNPNFQPNWEGGFYQPKVDRYRNAEYIENFAPDNEGRATKNLEQFEMLELFHEAKRQSDTLYGNDVNIYQQPQISKSQLEKIIDANRVGLVESARRGIKDTFTNRIDDQDYGVQENGGNIIPKKYVYQLEEATDVSLDLGYSYAELLYEANLYRQKKNSYSQVMTIRQSIEEQKFTKGKTGADSNTLKMAESFIEYNIFGKTQSTRMEVDVFGHKLDLSRMMLLIHKFIQWNALAFSPIISATNFTTGVVNKSLIEARLGQFINANSNAYAEKEFDFKEAPRMLSETGEISRTTKSYKILELGGVIDFRNRLQSASLGRVATAMKDLGYAGFAIGDQVLKSKVFIATFDDVRAVDGMFLNYNQYKLRAENTGLRKSEIVEKWNAFRDNSLWNLLENDGTKPLAFGEETLQKYGREYLENTLSNTLQKAGQTSASIDGQITDTEKSMASRDYLLRFSTGMRSYLFSGIQNRLQGRKYSFQQGQQIEGAYITGANYINDVVKKMISDKSILNLVGAVKSEWGNLDDVQKINMKRTLAEFAVYTALIAVGALALGAKDDDDDEAYLSTLASYILIRTTSETGSQLPGGFVNNIIDVVDKPIQAINLVKEVWKGGYFEELGAGSRYAGYNKITALAIKNTALKNIWQMGDIEKTRESYRFFNEETLMFLSNQDDTENVLSAVGIE